jgi:hypothetical protein
VKAEERRGDIYKGGRKKERKAGGRKLRDE